MSTTRRGFIARAAGVAAALMLPKLPEATRSPAVIEASVTPAGYFIPPIYFMAEYKACLPHRHTVPTHIVMPTLTGSA